ncbi:MAG: NADH-quinone oxidoreductase subunit L [Armatimonadetes bacterium]|nr:NADH-quinone oxidoreductase subunit L [Armatimonadota bacterium]
MISLAWLIPVIPLIAFAVIIFNGPKLRGKAAYVAIAAISASFLISVGVAAEWFFVWHAEEAAAFYIDWAPAGLDVIKMGITIDSLTIVMLFVVTIVSAMVQVYSVGYMHGDERYPRFFAYLSLFTSAMLWLVVANTLLLMFVSWELVGLTSYLLIGFWFQKPEAMRAAKKAFLVTRVGDIGFFLGLLTLYLNTGTMELTGVFAKAHEMAQEPVTVGGVGAIFSVILGIFAYGMAGAILKGARRLPSAIAAGVVVFGLAWLLLPHSPVHLTLASVAALLIFWGAVGKSAQFPLHVWLPDAMQGPTPVSALIHAATMVAAGVYLVARMYPIFHADPTALTVVAYVGAFTAVFAATMGIVMNDIKQVLAYSTISQLGYMMMGLGVGGYTAGMFHLMTHAYFKANLFLGSGSVIHGTGTQDIREMGGLAKKMPYTFWTFVIATAALAGLPFTAGFFSKDEILLTAYHWEHGKIIFYAGVIGAFLTAFYMTRLVVLTFFGRPRDPKVHAHESWKVMTIPLMVLAALSIVSGYVGAPWKNLFAHYVSIEALGIHGAHGEHHFSIAVAAMGTLAALLGIGLASIIWWRPVLNIQSLAPALGWVHTLVSNKYYMDDIYNIIVIRPLMFTTQAMFAFDRWLIDYVIVNGAGWVTMKLADIWGVFDRYVVDGLVNLVGALTKLGGRTLKFVQTGVVQQYTLILVVCVILIGWYFVVR